MAAAASKLPRTALLARFFARERDAALRSASTSQPQLPLRASNPFIPTYNAASGCWASPKYSRRRQRELLKAAAEEGKLEWMPMGVWADRSQEIVRPRRRGKRKEESTEAGKEGKEAVVEKDGDGKVEVEISGSSTVVEVDATPTEALAAAAELTDSPAPSLTSTTESSAPNPPQPAPDIPSAPTPAPLSDASPRATIPTAESPPPTDPNAPFHWLGRPPLKYTADTVYGIKPREKWFKGHKWQRMKEERTEETERRLKTMGDRVSDWKQAAKDDKKKVKSSLPF